MGFMKLFLCTSVLMVMAGCVSAASVPRDMDVSRRRSVDCVGKFILVQGRWSACTPEESVKSILATYRRITISFRRDPAHEAAPYEQVINLAPGELCAGRLPARVIDDNVLACAVYGETPELLEPQS
jgi:hypothetical protein